MPLRRTFLRAAAGIPALGPTTGCLTTIPGLKEAVVSAKSISVRWTDRDGRGIQATLCWLWYDGHGHVTGWMPTAYPGIVDSATDVRVSSETERRLRERFADVTFLIGFSQPVDSSREDDFGDKIGRGSFPASDVGRLGVPTQTFDRLQLGDRATVYPGDSGLQILSIDDDPHEGSDEWHVAIGTRDLREQYPEHDVPEP